jgi:mRNA interferase MazF
MAGHSRPKDGVALLAYDPAIEVVLVFSTGRKAWMPGTRPGMTTEKEARYDPFDVVVVPFPYADRLAEKRRPALVISNRKLALHGLVWVAMITSANNEAWSSDVAITDLKRAGLPAPSVVRVAKIACIEPARIDRRVGRLGESRGESGGAEAAGIFGSGVRLVSLTRPIEPLEQFRQRVDTTIDPGVILGECDAALDQSLCLRVKRCVANPSPLWPSLGFLECLRRQKRRLSPSCLMFV